MLFKSEHITQASGSVGGVTYSRNRGGMYRRARSIPTNTNTTFQEQVRSALTALVTSWTNDLTNAQRLAWNLYGENVPVINPLGSPIQLSGQNWYIACNTPRLQLFDKIGSTGPELIEAAPNIFDRGDFITPDLTWDASAGLSIAWTTGDPWSEEDGSHLLVYMGRPQNPSVQFFNGPWRLVGEVAGDATVAPTPPGTVTAANVELRGWPIVAGQSIWAAVAVSREDARLTTRRIIGPITAVP